MCRGVRPRPSLVPSAHGGARVVLGERERVSGLAHRPEDRTGTLVDGVHKRCGRQGRRECGTRLQRDLPLPWGPPTALSCPRVTVGVVWGWGVVLGDGAYLTARRTAQAPLWTVCTSGAVGKPAASAGHDCRGTYLAPCGPPTALSSRRLTVVLECYWASVSEKVA